MKSPIKKISVTLNKLNPKVHIPGILELAFYSTIILGRELVECMFCQQTFLGYSFEVENLDQDHHQMA